MALGDYSFNWDASTDTGGSGLKFYRVYKDGVQQGTTTNLWYPAGYGAYPTGCWSVKAEDNAGNLSGALTCISYADTTPPTQVTGVSATVADASTVITWNASTDNVGVTEYKIIISDSEAIPTVLTNYTTNLTFTQTGLVNGRQYTVTVQARDLAGNWSTLSTAVNVTPVAATTTTTTMAGDTPPPTTTMAGDTTPPSQVDGVIVSTPIDYTFRVDWNAATDNVGVTGYIIEESNDDVTWNIAGTTASNVTNITLGGYAGGEYRAFRVRAHDAAFNEGANSANGPSTSGFTTGAFV